MAGFAQPGRTSVTAPRANLDALVVGAAAIFVAIIVLHWLQPGRLVAEVDFFPDFDPWGLLAKSADAWGGVKTSWGGYDFPTYVPLYAASLALKALLGISGMQIALFWIVSFSAWAGAYAASRALPLGRIAAVCAATFYAVGPETLSTTTWISASAFLAVFPWIVFLIVLAGSRPGVRSRATIAACALSLLAFSIVGSTPQLFFSLVLASAAFFAFVWLRFGRERAFLFWFLKTAGLMAVCSLWWIVPVFVALASAKIVHATKTPDIRWVFANSGFDNAFRFITAWTWTIPAETPYAEAYDANPLTFFAGYTGMFGLCAAVALARSGLRGWTRFLLAVALTGLFITKGLHEPLAAVNGFLLSLPGFVLLIEPAGATLCTLFAVSLALGIAVDEAGRRITGLPFRRALGALVVAASLCAAFPLFSGSIFSTEDSPTGRYVALPQYWTDAAAYLNGPHASGSVLFVPPNGAYQASYRWGYQGVDIVPSSIVHRPATVLGPSLDYLDDARSQSVVTELSHEVDTRSPLLVPVLRSLGFTQIVCRGDLSDWTPRECDRFAAAYAMPARAFGPLRVYDVPAALPAAAGWPAWIGGTYDGVSPGALLQAVAIAEPMPRFHRDPRTDRIGGRIPAFVETAGQRVATLSGATQRFVWTGDQLGAAPHISASIDARFASAFGALQLPIDRLSLTAASVPASIDALYAPQIEAVCGGADDCRLTVLALQGDRRARLLDAKNGDVVTFALRTGRNRITVRRPGKDAEVFRFEPTPLHSYRTARMPLILTERNPVALIRSAAFPTGTIADFVDIEPFDRAAEPFVELASGAATILCPASSGAYLRIADLAARCDGQKEGAGKPFSLRAVDLAFERRKDVPVVTDDRATIHLALQSGYQERDAGAELQALSPNVRAAGPIATTQVFPWEARTALSALGVNGIVTQSSPASITLRAADGEHTFPVGALGTITPLIPNDARLAVRLKRAAPADATRISIASLGATTIDAVTGGRTVQLLATPDEPDVTLPGTPASIRLTIPALTAADVRIGVAAASLRFSNALRLTGAAPAARLSVARGGIASMNVRPGQRFTVRAPAKNGPASLAMLIARTGGARPVALHDRFSFGTIQIADVPCRACIVTNGQMFAQGWVAFKLGALPQLLDHVQANLWQNAWIAPDAPLVLIFNMVTVCEIACAFLGAAILIVLIVRNRWHDDLP